MSSAFSLGFSWFKDSCRTLKLQPLAYTGIVVFSLLMSGLLSSLPLIGTLLASLPDAPLSRRGAREPLDALCERAHRLCRT